jgi:hypothetical protein
VASFDYWELMTQFAPLLSDGRHFTYYYAACNDTFPELSLVAARMALQAALGKPVGVCPVRS